MSSTSIEDLAYFIVRSVHVEAVARNVKKLSSAQIEQRTNIVLCRQGLEGSAPLTLAECGAKFGLTRERVRQIVGDYRDFRSNFRGFKVAEKVVIFFLTEMSSSPDGSSAVLRLKELGHLRGRLLELEEIGEIVNWSGSQTAETKWRALLAKWGRRSRETETIHSSLVELRSKLDFVEMKLLRQKAKISTSISDTEVVERLREGGERFGYCDGLLFVPRSKPNRVEASVIRQLLLSAEGKLEVDEVWIGLQRSSRQRSLALPNTKNAVINCVVQVCGAVELSGNQVSLNRTNLSGYPIQKSASTDSTLSKLIAEILRRQERCMHIYEIIEWAANEGFKPSTLMQYARYDDSFRGYDEQVVYVVGNSPGASELELKSDSIRLQFRDREYCLDDGSLDQLSIIIDPRWYFSGRINIPAPFARVNSGDFKLYCTCTGASKKTLMGPLSVTFGSSNGVINPPNNLLNHLVEVHHLKLGNRFRLSFENKIVVLSS